MNEYDPAMERARARAHQLGELYGHLIAYALVSALLVVIDLATGSNGTTFIGLNWAYWPILGWGIAVVIHVASVVFSLDGWEDRKAQQLYEREQHRELRGH